MSDKYVQVGDLATVLCLNGELYAWTLLVKVLVEPLQQFGSMRLDGECVVDILSPHVGLEWGRGDGLLLNVFHEQVADDGGKGRARGRSICLLVPNWKYIERRLSSVRCMSNNSCGTCFVHPAINVTF